MPKAKGIPQIARRLGVSPGKARDLVRKRAFALSRRGDRIVASFKHLDDYRLDQNAAASWETEGGALGRIGADT